MGRWRRIGLVAGAFAVVMLLAGGWMAVRAKQASDALARAKDGVASVREALEAGQPEAAAARLAIVQSDTARAADLTSDPVFAVAAQVPVLGRTPAAVTEVAAAADTLATGVLEPLVAAATELDPRTLRVGWGAVDVAALERALPPLQEAGAGLELALAQLEAIELAGTPDPLQTAVRSVDAELSDLDGDLASLTEAVRLLPPMLGADGPRRYLVALQSNSEARGTGGLLGTWGVLRVTNGELRLEELLPRSSVAERLYDRPPVDFGPDYAALYGEQAGMSSSANLSPHFPYAAQLWLQMWEDRTGERLDGVITTDPVATEYLLRAVDRDIEVPDGTPVIPAEAFAEFVGHRVYSFLDDDYERDLYLRRVGWIAINNLLRFNGDPQLVLEALGQAAGERRLLVYSTDPGEQAALEGMAVGGAIPTGPGPFAGLGLINGSGSKADYFVTPELTYELLSCDGAEQRTRITATLRNRIEAGQRLPDYVLYRKDLATPGNPNPTGDGSTLMFAQVYGAEGAALVEARVDGRRVPVAAGVERGHPVYRFPVVVPAGGSVSVAVDLVEPAHPGPARTFTTPLIQPAVVHADTFECVAAG